MKTRSELSSLGLTILLLIVISAATPLFGQIAGGLSETTRTAFGGDSFIAGIVFTPAGIPVNYRIRVRLTSVTGTEVLSNTDENGRFVFGDLTRGTYTVSVDGEQDFETASRQVEVLQGKMTFEATLKLVQKVKPANKPQIFNIENATVNKKALDIYDRAAELSKAGDNRGAVAQLKLAVAEDPAFMVGFTEMGVQYLKLNELENAEAALQSALKLKPDAYEPLVNSGIVYFRMKRYPEAETMLRRAIAAKDQSAVGHYYLGRSLAALKKYDDAEKELNAAITTGGEEMKEAHRMLASMFLEMGDDKRALAALETYLKLAPTAPDAAKLRTAVEQLKAAPQKP